MIKRAMRESNVACLAREWHSDTLFGLQVLFHPVKDKRPPLKLATFWSTNESKQLQDHSNFGIALDK